MLPTALRVRYSSGQNWNFLRMKQMVTTEMRVRFGHECVRPSTILAWLRSREPQDGGRASGKSKDPELRPHALQSQEGGRVREKESRWVQRNMNGLIFSPPPNEMNIRTVPLGRTFVCTTYRITYIHVPRRADRGHSSTVHT